MKNILVIMLHLLRGDWQAAKPSLWLAVRGHAFLTQTSIVCGTDLRHDWQIQRPRLFPGHSLSRTDFELLFSKDNEI